MGGEVDHGRSGAGVATAVRDGVDRYALAVAGVGFSLFLLQVIVSSPHLSGLEEIRALFPSYPLQATLLIGVAMVCAGHGRTRLMRLAGVGMTALIFFVAVGLIFVAGHSGGCLDAVDPAIQAMRAESWGESHRLSSTWSGDARCVLLLDSGAVTQELTWWQYLGALGR